MPILSARFVRPAEAPPRLPLPILLGRVPAGFPSPAADFVEGRLDLNEHLIARPAATFIVRVAGHSMTGVGIFPGDLAIVDRSMEPRSGDIVIAVVNGDLTIKRLEWDGPRRRASGVRLVAAHPDYPVIHVAGDDVLDIWGVVTSTIHSFRSA